jgi:hypothetical protein
MTSRTVTVTAHSDQPVEQVWALLSNIDTWTQWAPVRSATRERPGTTEPDGVGSIRSFRTPIGTTIREEIERYEAPNVVGYNLLSGLPIRDYHSVVTLTPAGGGTDIDWESRFDGRPATGWFWSAFMKMTLRQYAGALAKATAPASSR